MPSKRHKTEEIIHKLREAEILLGQDTTVPEVCKQLGVSEQTYYRWRKLYGGMQVDQAKRLKALEEAIDALLGYHDNAVLYRRSHHSGWSGDGFVGRARAANGEGNVPWQRVRGRGFDKQCGRAAPQFSTMQVASILVGVHLMYDDLERWGEPDQSERAT